MTIVGFKNCKTKPNILFFHVNIPPLRLNVVSNSRFMIVYEIYENCHRLGLWNCVHCSVLYYIEKGWSQIKCAVGKRVGWWDSIKFILFSFWELIFLKKKKITCSVNVRKGSTSPSPIRTSSLSFLLSKTFFFWTTLKFPLKCRTGSKSQRRHKNTKHTQKKINITGNLKRCHFHISDPSMRMI